MTVILYSVYKVKKMIEIKEVKSRRDKARFVDFPTKLYEDCPYYVHPLRSDEMNLFNRKKNVSYDDCEAVYYLALKDDEVVGRIAGIIQNLYNEKTNEKRVRFTRFDCIDDVEVAKKLFEAVENWARVKGMNIVHGPMGFNDLDREGMLVEGYDHDSTFEEQYNYPYYPKLVEACGYSKEIDWLEYKIFPPKEMDERIDHLSDAVLKRYHLRVGTAKNKKEYINKYKEGLFKVLDEAYGDLYGVVPFTDRLREQIVEQFHLFISLKYIIVIVDENDEVVAFGFAIPSLSKAVRKSKGRFLPFGIFRMLKAIKKPRVVDFGLIGIKKSYQNKGLTAVILRFVMQQMKNENIEYCETNLNLEDNIKIHLQWKNFEHEQHKRRRSYVKKLDS